MGRQTNYNNNLVTEEKLALVLPENLELMEDFLAYCVSANRASSTIKQYKNQLRIFFVWNQERNKDVFFTEIKKRDFVKFFGYVSEEIEASPSRLTSFRAVLSSLSNYIETVLDDEYPNFKNCIKSLDSVPKVHVREKTVLTDEKIEWCLDYLVKNQQYELACYLALLMSSGMRKSEVLQMEVSFFTTKQKIVLNCMYETGKIRTKGRGKQGKQISRFVFKETFDPYLNLWLEQREKKGIKSPYLFVRYKNGQYLQAHTSTLNSWSDRLSKMMEVPFYPHCMRHYFTTSLKRRGYPDNIIQKIVKWSSMAMVSIYNDMSEEEELGDFFAQGKDIIPTVGVGIVEEIQNQQKEAEEASDKIEPKEEKEE